MIRLSYPSAQQGQRTAAFTVDVVRFGTDPRCELRLAGSREVARNHGDIVEEGSTYLVIATNARCLLWVDGKQVERARLRGGERIRVGARYGPEIHVVEVRDSRVRTAPPVPSERERSHEPEVDPEVEPDESEDRTIGLTSEQVADLQAAARRAAVRESSGGGRRPTRNRISKPPPPVPQSPSQSRVPVLTGLPTPKGRPLDTSDSFTVAKFLRRPHAEVQRWLTKAQEEIRQARSGYDGESSGHTMVIFANALAGLRQTAEGRTQQWRRMLVYLACASVVVVSVLGGVIWYQQKRIDRFIKEKGAIDMQIQGVFDAMANETDQAKLSQLEARLQVLMGNASEKVMEVSRANARKGGELADPHDELERELRRLLKSFNAETYAIPPLFKRTLKTAVAELAASPGLKANYAKKMKVWPQLQAALRTRELPQELGYITFTESRFEPTAVSPVGAVGMWQLMAPTARTCGLTVNGKHDERYDVGRSSEAAACYLSNLLVEFGQESFMLVLASYNRGENGVRHALHKVAQEPGGWRMRDFWHLYRLKLLPDETRDYVPRVLAAAIVFENPEQYGLKPEKAQP